MRLRNKSRKVLGTEFTLDKLRPSLCLVDVSARWPVTAGQSGRQRYGDRLLAGRFLPWFSVFHSE